MLLAYKNNKCVLDSHQEQMDHASMAPIPPLPVMPDNTQHRLEQKVVRNKIYRFYVSEVIYSKQPWYYPLLQTLIDTRNHEDDRVIIHLNNHGGSINDMIQIVNHINTATCKVDIIVEGVAASAAVMMICGGKYDRIIISEHSMILFHNASTFVYGKLNNIADNVAFLNKMVEKLYADWTRHVLTPEEVKSIRADKELWMTGKELLERMKYRNEMLEKERLAAERRQRREENKAGKVVKETKPKTKRKTKAVKEEK